MHYSRTSLPLAGVRPATGPSRRHRLLAVALLCATALAGCNKESDTATANGAPATGAPIAALALATAAPLPMAYAPPVEQMAAAPLHIAVRRMPRGDRYRYIEDASTMSGAFGATPPDYTVDYEGTRPWVWRSDGGDYRIVELMPGGERVYYYHAGASEPFLIRDPDYAYAYDGNDFVGAYGPDGAPLDDMIASQHADAAGAYLYRARGLYRAATQEQRQAAYAANWQQRQSTIWQQQQSWDATRERDAEWHRWHDEHQTQQDDHWAHERDQRAAYAAAIGVVVGAAGVALFAGHHDGQDSGGQDRGGLNQPQGGPAGAGPVMPRPAAMPRNPQIPGQPYAGQGYAGQGYSGQPPASQPYTGQQRAGQAQPGQQRSDRQFTGHPAQSPVVRPAQPNPAPRDAPAQRPAYAPSVALPAQRSAPVRDGSHDFQGQNPRRDVPAGPGLMAPVARPHPPLPSVTSQRDRPIPPAAARMDAPPHPAMDSRPAIAPHRASDVNATVDRPQPAPHPVAMSPQRAPESGRRPEPHSPSPAPKPARAQPAGDPQDNGRDRSHDNNHDNSHDNGDQR